MKALRFAFASLALVVGCKPETQSSTKSLDNLARKDGQIRTNECRGDFRQIAVEPVVQFDATIDRSSEQALNLSRIVGETLTAVPEAVRAPFFEKNGAIRVSKDVAKICDEAVKQPLDAYYYKEGGAFVACASLLEGGEFSIFVKDDETVIRHHLVRLMGRFFSEVIVDAAETLDASVASRNPGFVRGAAVMRESRSDLARVFYDEVQAKLAAGGRFDLGQMGKAYASGDAVGVKFFEHVVFAEAFDSAYCNASTRKSFGEDFPVTYAVFMKKVFLPFTAIQAKDIVKSGKIKTWRKRSASAEGLSLTGGTWYKPWTLGDYLFSPANTGGKKNQYDTTAQYNAEAEAYARQQAEFAAGQKKPATVDTTNLERAAKDPTMQAVIQHYDRGVYGPLKDLAQEGGELSDQQVQAVNDLSNGDFSGADRYVDAERKILQKAGNTAVTVTTNAYRAVAPGPAGVMVKGAQAATGDPTAVVNAARTATAPFENEALNNAFDAYDRGMKMYKAGKEAYGAYGRQTPAQGTDVPTYDQATAPSTTATAAEDQHAAAEQDSFAQEPIIDVDTSLGDLTVAQDDGPTAQDLSQSVE